MLQTLLASPGGQAFFGNLGAGLGQGLSGAMGGGPDPSALISGAGGLDGRAQLDGSGWTVATGRSVAYGQTVPNAPRPSVFDSVPSFGADPAGGLMRAGVSPWVALAMLAIFGGLLLRRRKG